MEYMAVTAAIALMTQPRLKTWYIKMPPEESFLQNPAHHTVYVLAVRPTKWVEDIIKKLQ